MNPARGNGCFVRGSGTSQGALKLTSQELEGRFQLGEGWIVERTGVESRPIAEPGVRTNELAAQAARAALADAGVAPADLGLVICATMTPEMPCPATSHRVIDMIGATPCGGFDVTAACTGFMAGMNLAANGIRAGAHEHVLVIGADLLSRIVAQDDPRMAVLFGDAGAAVVLSRCDEPDRGCLVQHLASDGSQWPLIYQPSRLEDLPPGAKMPSRWGLLTMHGPSVFRFAVSTLVKIIPEAMAAAGLTLADADLVILHQSNMRIIEKVRTELRLSPERCPAVIQSTGNTSGGSVGMVIDAVRKEGRLPPGLVVVYAAVGGGLCWGASVWRT
jgi:3-oxoacyl-[acyl-carrier-protein] synthase-3